jgi:hypothetical protein
MFKKDIGMKHGTLDEEGNVFLDRDPVLFRQVLNICTFAKLPKEPKGDLKKELKYWFPGHYEKEQTEGDKLLETIARYLYEVFSETHDKDKFTIYVPNSNDFPSALQWIIDHDNLPEEKTTDMHVILDCILWNIVGITKYNELGDKIEEISCLQSESYYRELRKLVIEHQYELVRIEQNVSRRCEYLSSPHVLSNLCGYLKKMLNNEYDVLFYDRENMEEELRLPNGVLECGEEGVTCTTMFFAGVINGETELKAPWGHDFFSRSTEKGVYISVYRKVKYMYADHYNKTEDVERVKESEFRDKVLKKLSYLLQNLSDDQCNKLDLRNRKTEIDVTDIVNKLRNIREGVSEINEIGASLSIISDSLRAIQEDSRKLAYNYNISNNQKFWERNHKKRQRSFHKYKVQRRLTKLQKLKQNENGL